MGEITPGPWRVERMGSGAYRIVAMQGPVEVFPAISYTGLDDARLIAAAPDLLEALQKIAQLKTEDLTAAVIAGVAIAKATGAA